MLRFKKEQLRKQFDSKLDVRLKILVHALASFIQHRFGKDLIVTSVYRGDDKLSVHYYWRGIDFRIIPEGGKPVYSRQEIMAINAFCKRFEYSSDPKKRKYATLKVHDAGSGLHGHLQVNGTSVTRIIK